MMVRREEQVLQAHLREGYVKVRYVILQGPEELEYVCKSLPSSEEIF